MYIRGETPTTISLFAVKHQHQDHIKSISVKRCSFFLNKITHQSLEVENL